jgi:hypothetical protein
MGVQKYKRIHPKKKATHDVVNQITESPILFRSCEHETPFSDQNEASKIGDSDLCRQRHRVRLYTHLANILPLYKRIHPKKKATHDFVNVIPCVCIFVHPSKRRMRILKSGISGSGGSGLGDCIKISS